MSFPSNHLSDLLIAFRFQSKLLTPAFLFNLSNLICMLSSFLF